MRNKYADGAWVLGGDFNASKTKEERYGRNAEGRRKEMEEFSSFIDLTQLTNVPVLGNKHTWINSNGSTSSRLDRFLISEGLI